jgi:hypothetical protein
MTAMTALPPLFFGCASCKAAGGQDELRVKRVVDNVQSLSCPNCGGFTFYVYVTAADQD